MLQEDIDKAIIAFELLLEKIPQPKVAATAKTAKLSAPGNNANAPLEAKVTIKELLNALNHLSQFSSNYMGPKLTANYWQSARPNFDWLANFQINNNSAEIAFSGVVTESVSALQHQWVKEWTAAFIKRSSQIVRDLPTIIGQKGLDERQKQLLLISPAG